MEVKGQIVEAGFHNVGSGFHHGLGLWCVPEDQSNHKNYVGLYRLNQFVLATRACIFHSQHEPVIGQHGSLTYGQMLDHM